MTGEIFFNVLPGDKIVDNTTDEKTHKDSPPDQPEIIQKCFKERMENINRVTENEKNNDNHNNKK